MIQQANKMITVHPAFYRGVADDSFRRGERGEIITIIAMMDERNNTSLHFHVRYDDGFEYLAPMLPQESYEILGPKQKRIESMRISFARIDKQQKGRKHDPDQN